MDESRIPFEFAFRREPMDVEGCVSHCWEEDGSFSCELDTAGVSVGSSVVFRRLTSSLLRLSRMQRCVGDG